MGVLSLALLAERLSSPNQQVRNTSLQEVASCLGTIGQYPRTSPNSWDDRIIAPVINMEAAREMYNQLRDRVTTNGWLWSKSFRPYLWRNVTDMGLDPDQPWWGFEFETGYSSRPAMATALGYCWDNFDDVTFDGEGEGEYYSEVTFAPANMSSYLDGEAPAVRYINYLSENRALTNHTGHAFIGTHINISTPSMRSKERVREDYGYHTFERVQRALNHSLGLMADDDVSYIFGRSPVYGGFYLNSDGKSNYWFEGKLFRTTYDAEIFGRYVTASHGITKCVEYLENNNSVVYVKNFTEVLRDPSVAPIGGTQAEFNATGGGRIDEYGDPLYYEDPEYDYYDDEEAF